jgi:hypothetical protein
MRGLVALWRESLLAQKVLRGETVGYKHHPQLDRFKKSSDPKATIASYLEAVCDEAEKRNYSFDRCKICSAAEKPEKHEIEVTRGQLDYELNLLAEKLALRDPARQKKLLEIAVVECHPIFDVIEGEIAPWEKAKPWIRPRAR